MFAQLLAEALVGAGMLMTGVICAMVSSGALYFVLRHYNWIGPGIPTTSRGPG